MFLENPLDHHQATNTVTTILGTDRTWKLVLPIMHASLLLNLPWCMRMAIAVITMTMSATPAAEAMVQSMDCISGALHDLADSTAAVVCRLMRRVSVSVISIRLLWRCRGKVVWVSSTPMPRLLLLLMMMRVRVPGAIRQLWWFIRLAGTGIKVDY